MIARFHKHIGKVFTILYGSGIFRKASISRARNHKCITLLRAYHLFCVWSFRESGSCIGIGVPFPITANGYVRFDDFNSSCILNGLLAKQQSGEVKSLAKKSIHNSAASCRTARSTLSVFESSFEERCRRPTKGEPASAFEL